jgi:putative glycosyltransferase (TIGR04348 family)
VKAFIVTPAAPGTSLGNSITAQRWAGILRGLGHHVAVAKEWSGEGCDVLVALHARRSSTSIERFHHANPKRPLIVALTGTDLYANPSDAEPVLRSLSSATRIVALQSLAGAELNDEMRSKLFVIYQSAVAPAQPQLPRDDCVEVAVLSHLRDVKDPLRAAWASRSLPSESRIQIVHAGQALEPKWKQLALDQQQMNPRYRWLGERDHDEALQLLARSRVLVVSSEIEGGANVIAEAVVCGVPILCSNIAGNIGMLGADYPGYFQLRDTAELCALLNRVETDSTFLETLRQSVQRLRNRFAPEEEQRSWAQLLQEVGL